MKIMKLKNIYTSILYLKSIIKDEKKEVIYPLQNSKNFYSYHHDYEY